MKKVTKILVRLLTICLLCSSIPGSLLTAEASGENEAVMQAASPAVSGGDVFIEGTEETSGSVSENDALYAGLEEKISVSGGSSFGIMLANELSTEILEQQENNGCNVFSAEIQDQLAIVSFETVEDAVLVIGIYDETGTEMLASGSTEVLAGETAAVVEFEQSLPQYFYIKGFLVEPVTYRPLCTVYESPVYTREMQEFLAKTTADFDADRVLNLDGDETNNFAVFGEETVRISGGNGFNKVVMADEVSNTYVIENADGSITSLQPGNVFAYSYTDKDVLIVKVASIQVAGSTVTISGADTSMEEVFDYIKIDTEMGSGEAAVDPLTCDEGVIYEGVVDYVEEDTQSYAFIDGGGSAETALKYSLDKKLGSIDGINVTLSGGLEMKLTFSAKVYLSAKQQYVELKLDYSARIFASITGEASAEIPLVTVGFMPVAGVIVELTPSIVIETQASISLEGTLSGTVGFRAQLGSGIINLTTRPQFKPAVKMEGSIFFGFSLCPRVKIISEKVASVSLTAKVGAEVKGSIKDPLAAGEENKKHTCRVCIAGEIYGKFNISAKLTFLNATELTITPADIRIKAGDFYYSADYDSFGWSVCPYYLLKGKIIVLDSAWKPIRDVAVRIDGKTVTTDENGMTEVWLSEKNYILSVGHEGYKNVLRNLTLKEGGESLLVVLEKAGTGDGGDGGKPDEGGDIGDGDGGEDVTAGKKIVRVSLGNNLNLGGNHSTCSAAITEEGDLYLWGDTYYGHLGDGTEVGSLVPIKIMSGVKEVSAGAYHRAAITEEGDLYLWGNNSLGELGDGTGVESFVPIKIMSGVKEVSLGQHYSAAITEEGDLYLWGYNYYGELGDGTCESSYIPKKIMSGVKKVSLGSDHSAAITEEGDLYLWGRSVYGELGDGMSGFSNIPQKIMSGVKEVSLGSYHSAAITEEGDLYLWGYNRYGQLGDGTGVDSLVPQKIMSGVKEVSLGSYHSAAITEEGDLYLWGDNYDGGLGDGTCESSNIPQKIMSGVKKVSLGSEHSAAITEEGDLYLWGYNGYGQLGDGTTNNSTIPIKIDIPPVTASTSAFSLFTAEETPTEETLALSTSPSNWTGTGFANLMQNETYNYYVIKNKETDQPFSADNLFYIGQAVSDESGTMQAAFTMKEAYADADIFAVPMHPMDLSGASVTVSDLTYNGEEQYARAVVTYKGLLLVEGLDYYVSGDYAVTQTGDYTLTIEGIGLYTGTVSAYYKLLPATQYLTVTGTVASFGEESVQTTVRLLSGSGDVVSEAKVTGNHAEYALENVAEGEYTLQISKPNHVSREYSVTVTDGQGIQDAELWLIGDVDGSGGINAKDKKRLFEHMAGTPLTGYAFQVGDVDGSGSINAKDRKRLFDHMAGTEKLW